MELSQGAATKDGKMCFAAINSTHPYGRGSYGCSMGYGQMQVLFTGSPYIPIVCDHKPLLSIFESAELADIHNPKMPKRKC